MNIMPHDPASRARRVQMGIAICIVLTPVAVAFLMIGKLA